MKYLYNVNVDGLNVRVGDIIRTKAGNTVVISKIYPGFPFECPTELGPPIVFVYSFIAKNGQESFNIVYNDFFQDLFPEETNSCYYLERKK